MDGELAGGIYGVAIGRMFFGESMFARRTDASKIAMVAPGRAARSVGISADRLPAGNRRTCVSLGAEPMPRRQFVAEVARLVEEPAPAWDAGCRPCRRLGVTPRGPRWQARRRFSGMIRSWQIPRSANGSRPIRAPTSASNTRACGACCCTMTTSPRRNSSSGCSESIFHMPHADAFAIMMHVHQAGVGVAGPVHARRRRDQGQGHAANGRATRISAARHDRA